MEVGFFKSTLSLSFGTSFNLALSLKKGEDRAAPKNGVMAAALFKEAPARSEEVVEEEEEVEPPPPPPLSGSKGA